MKQIIWMSAILSTLTACAAVPLKWTVESSHAAPVTYDVYHGETLNLEATFKSYGRDLTLPTNEIAKIYWQTNGMESAWWHDSAAIISNRMTATWVPAMDPGADRVHVFLGIEGSIYRADLILRFRHSPANPNHLYPPIPVLDFDEVEVHNAPWQRPLTAGDNIVITNDVISALGGGGGGITTNDVRGIIAADTNLAARLNAKQNALTAGNNISITTNKVIMVSGLPKFDNLAAVADAATNYTDAAVSGLPTASDLAAVADAATNYTDNAAQAATNYTDAAVAGSIKTNEECVVILSRDDVYVWPIWAANGYTSVITPNEFSVLDTHTGIMSTMYNDSFVTGYYMGPMTGWLGFSSLHLSPYSGQAYINRYDELGGEGRIYFPEFPEYQSHETNSVTIATREWTTGQIASAPYVPMNERNVSQVGHGNSLNGADSLVVGVDNYGGTNTILFGKHCRASRVENSLVGGWMCTSYSGTSTKPSWQKNSIALGNRCLSSTDSIALGFRAFTATNGYFHNAQDVTKVSNVEGNDAKRTFVWQGYAPSAALVEPETDESVAIKSSYYHSHGDGTFNVKPQGGVEGFYIGETNLAQTIKDYARTGVTPTASATIKTNHTAALSFTYDVGRTYYFASGFVREMQFSQSGWPEFARRPFLFKFGGAHTLTFANTIFADGSSAISGSSGMLYFEVIRIGAQYIIDRQIALPSTTITDAQRAATYTEVEYIASTVGGNQYIDTGVASIPGYTYDAEIKVDVTNTYNSVIGACSSGATERMYPFYFSAQGVYAYKWNPYIGAAYTTQSEISPSNMTVSIKTGTDGKSGSEFKVNGTSVSMTKGTEYQISTNGCGNLYLFARNNNGNADLFFTGRIYSFKITKTNGVIARDYVPVRRNDGVYGLLDKLSNKFYASLSATPFAGPSDAAPPLMMSAPPRSRFTVSADYPQEAD